MFYCIVLNATGGALDKEVKAAILVGGKSSRIGENKSFLRFGDTFLLDVIIRRIRTVIADTYLIANATFPRRDVPFPVLNDTYADKGPLGGIYTALSKIDAEFVFICAGDMPFINPELIRLLIAQMNREHDAVVPSHHDQREPLCALYNQKAKTAIGKAIEDGNLSVHGVLDRLSVLAVDENAVKSFGDHIFFNINTRDDYQRALHMWSYDKN